MSMFKRADAVKYATDYWWRPTKDGVVYVKSKPVVLAKVAQRNLKDYVGVFLWYPAKNTSVSRKGMWEALCLVSKATAEKIEKKPHEDRLLSDYADAIPLASFKDDYAKQENLRVFPTQPPYVGLNDCTHFTSQCLIAGGFPVTNDKAQRGAGDLVQYLFGAPNDVTPLCFNADHDVVQAVVDAGVVREGDVFAYHTDKKAAHHTVPAVSPRTVAMHTWRATDVPWDDPWDTNMSSETYSLFHFKDDKYTTPEAKQWLGWWKVETFDGPAGKAGAKSIKTEYYHFGDTGALTVSDTVPSSGRKPDEKQLHRWYARDAIKSKTAVVVRRNQMYDTVTTVEVFTPGADPKGPAAGAVKNPPKGPKTRLEVTRVS
jgi:hypothetical protein